MKQLLLTVLLFLTGLRAHAQAADWTFLLPVADLNGVMAIATGPDGSSYLTGRFVGSLALGATTLRSTAPGQCLYVTKCSPTGQVLRTTLLEGAASVLPRAITVDAAGNCYVTGSFRGTLSYNQGQHTTAQTMAPGGTDIFLLRCGPGGRVRWVSQATGGTSASNCTGIGLATDCAGNSYITGSANGDNLRFGAQTFGARRFQGFVASYDAAGQLRWARVWDNPAPGFSSSPGGAVAVDNAGNCYVSGTSLRGWALDGITLLSPNNTVFLARFGARTGRLQWALATPGEGDGRALALDQRGDVYLGGSFSGTVAFGPVSLTSAGDADGFVARYDPSGDVDWATALGGPNYDVVSDLAVSQRSRQVFATGLRNFTPAGTNQSFLARLGASGHVQQLVLVAGPGTSSCSKLALDAQNNVYSTGVFTGNCQFGPLARSTTATSAYFGRYGSRLVLAAASEAADAQAAIFPNPAQAQLTIRLPKRARAARATLYNQLGYAVAERQAVSSAPSADITFDTSTLPNGLYTLRLEADQYRSSQLVVVQH